MSLRLPLKWAIILVLIIAAVKLIPPIMAGEYSQVGGAFVEVAIVSLVIIALGTWDEYHYQKEKEKNMENKPEIKK